MAWRRFFKGVELESVRRQVAEGQHIDGTDEAPDLTMSFYGGDPADAFDVVVPDMPGYGYSDIPTGAPLNSREVAGLWARLMDRIGYDTYGTAGGDMAAMSAATSPPTTPTTSWRAPYERRPCSPERGLRTLAKAPGTGALNNCRTGYCEPTRETPADSARAALSTSDHRCEERR